MYSLECLATFIYVYKKNNNFCQLMNINAVAYHFDGAAKLNLTT